MVRPLQEYYHYEDADFLYHLTGVTDAKGIRYASWSYDENGFAISSQHALGVDRVTVDYDGVGEITQTRIVTNALGKQAVYSLLSRSSSLTIIGVEGQASPNCAASDMTKIYDDSGFYKTRGLTGTVDKEGRTTSYQRDDLGRITNEVRAQGLPEETSISTIWHEQFRKPLQTVRNGLTTDFEYDGQGRLLSMTQMAALGGERQWDFTYQGVNIASIDGPLAGTDDTQYFTYLGQNLLSATNELGHVTQMSNHNSYGLPMLITDANQVETALGYDGFNRVTRIVQNSGGTVVAQTQIAYDAVGNVLRITPPNGAYTRFTYDEARRMKTMQNAVGETIEFSHNAMRGVTQMSLKSSNGTIVYEMTQILDQLNRVIRSIGAPSLLGEGAAGALTTQFGYDKESNPVSTQDPRGGQWTQAFDGLNRLIQTKDAIGAQTELTRAPTHDGRDDLTQVKDARGAITTYTLNGYGEVVAEINPETGRTTYGRDGRGLVTQMTDARGVVTNYTYDAAGRPLSVSYPDAAENIGYEWDQGDFGIGQLSTVTQGFGTTDYAYNALGHMVEMTRMIGTQTYITAYSYDAAGEVLSITHPSGRVVRFTRDAAARIITVEAKSADEASFTQLLSNISYTAFGPMTGALYGDGHSLHLEYDKAYRASTLLRLHAGGVSLMDVNFEYNQNGDITALLDGVHPKRSQNFTYNAVSRLTTADGGYGDLSYAYNLVGDRTVRQWVKTGGDNPIMETEDYRYDSVNFRLSEIVDGNDAVRRKFTYSPSGHVINDERSDAVYDYGINQRGRVNRVHQDGAQIASYTYDDDEQRIVKTIAGQDPIHYLYDHEGRLIAEHNGATGETIREYVWIGLMPIATYGGLDNGTEVCDEERIAQIEEKITSKTANIAGKQTKIATTQVKITDKQAKILVKQDKIAIHTAKITEFEAKIANLNPNNVIRRAALEAKIVARQVRIAALTQQIDTLQTRVAELGAKIQNWQDRITILESQLTRLNTRLVTLNEQCEATGTGAGTGVGEQTAGNNSDLYYLHTDHLGKTVFATDTTGAVVWDGGITTPFGESLTLTSAFTQNLMFPGQYADRETGLSHNHHRTYDPTLGRYLQPDPIGLAGGLNRYAYVGGNPVNLVDPTGEIVPIAIIAGGFIFGYGADMAMQYFTNGRRLNCVNHGSALVSGIISTIPFGRAGYVLGAKFISKTAKSAREAYNRRNQLKKSWRFGLHKQIEKKRPTRHFDSGYHDVKKAGKTNLKYNFGLIGGVGVIAGVSIGHSSRDCGC